MRGHKLELFLLRLSFIGWIILGIFTLGILYIWLAPYMSVAQAEFYERIKGETQSDSLIIDEQPSEQIF